VHAFNRNELPGLPAIENIDPLGCNQARLFLQTVSPAANNSSVAPENRSRGLPEPFFRQPSIPGDWLNVFFYSAARAVLPGAEEPQSVLSSLRRSHNQNRAFSDLRAFQASARRAQSISTASVSSPRREKGVRGESCQAPFFLSFGVMAFSRFSAALSGKNGVRNV
jgi:hypothetical protein